MKRRFNLSERITLYSRAKGHCQGCGCKLQAGWHGDHVQPYSAGGATEETNGQALCPACNQKKGAKVAQDTVTLRPVQQRMVDALRNKIALRHTAATGNGATMSPVLIVADLHPGTGKTLGYEYSLNDLFRRGLIDTAAIFTPRLNLCHQCELGWKEDRQKFAEPVMGTLIHRDNNPPLIRDNQFGYVSTYASLVSKPIVHLDFFKEYRGRIALVLDEAQQLGADDLTGINTRSADIVQQLAPYAAFIIVLSGTPYRADNKPLLFASYTAPDEDGIRYLQADITATYLEGVAQGYLRPFEYDLVDGRALYEYVDGDQENLILSEMDGGLAKVLEEPGYWQPVVDKTIEVLREVQEIDGRLCGLIGANRQRHAEEIIAYIESKHKGIRALLAVSDEKLAQDNLRAFKKGGYDILVTVAMAHVGYDHKPISVVAALNAYRETGWLDQFFGRGMRVMPDIPIELQTLRAIVPDDLRMAAYVDQKRKESQRGLKERKPGGEGPVTGQPRLGVTQEAELIGIRAMGMDPEGDLAPSGYVDVENYRKEFGLGPVNKTGLGRLIATLTNGSGNGNGSRPPAIPASARQPSDGKSGKTEKEWEALLRKRIRDLGCKADKLLGWNFGETALYIKARTGKGTPELGKEGLKERLHWLETEWLPKAEAIYASKKT